MRVLHIGLCSIMGGIESFALNYMSKLSEKGVVFDFADIYGEGIAGADKIKALGGKIISLPSYKKHPLKVVLRLTKVLQEGGYDAVHINAQTAANILPALAAYYAGVTPAIHAHVVNEEGTVRRILHRLNLRFLRRLPAVHLACGREAGEWLWGDLHFEIIPNAVDLQQYTFSEENRQRIRNQLSVDEHTILLGYVGRLEPVKNPLYAVRLLKQYKKKYPDAKIKLLVVGDGSLYPQMKAEIAACGIGDSVVMAGMQNNVAQYLSAMDAFLMPSLHEGISLAAIEAQSNGLSCTFADTITEEVKILDTASFLPLDNMDCWVEHIRAISEKPHCSRIAAAEIAEDTVFNIDRSAEALLNTYYQLMKINGRKL